MAKTGGKPAKSRPQPEVDAVERVAPGKTAAAALAGDVASSLASVHGWSGETIEDLAAFLGIDRNTVAAWFRGDSSPRLTQALALADHYGISLEALVGRAGLPARAPRR